MWNGSDFPVLSFSSSFYGKLVKMIYSSKWWVVASQNVWNRFIIQPENLHYTLCMGNSKGETTLINSLINHFGNGIFQCQC
jgi:hypothetical protein